MNEDQRPLMVTIRCCTYNHEPYIRQCLEGFVMQKTNFRFEAIVHDDASTDGTAAIIREYAEKYPDIIKPIFETENQYSKHDGSLRRIMEEHMHGKYVALCEGDDYWIDPLKLQKQVDFMECHPNYTMCFHNAIEHHEDGKQRDRVFSKVEDRDYKSIEIYEKWIVPTASVVYVKTILTTELYQCYTHNANIIYGDLPLFLTCCNYGEVHGFSDVMSVYRRHSGGLTAIRDAGMFARLAQYNKVIPQIFGEHLRIQAEWMYIHCLLRASMYSFLTRKWNDAGEFIKEAFASSISKSLSILYKNIWKLMTLRQIAKCF